ncbi:MAG: hypothetical protein M3389_08800, partial [Actinomycetota bacterium]|nr:hypothetical protein [Actinomycetota bacterium]
MQHAGIPALAEGQRHEVEDGDGAAERRRRQQVREHAGGLRVSAPAVATCPMGDVAGPATAIRRTSRARVREASNSAAPAPGRCNALIASATPPSCTLATLAALLTDSRTVALTPGQRTYGSCMRALLSATTLAVALAACGDPVKGEV